jgi:hypothetical protein
LFRIVQFMHRRQDFNDIAAHEWKFENLNNIEPFHVENAASFLDKKEKVCSILFVMTNMKQLVRLREQKKTSGIFAINFSVR